MINKSINGYIGISKEKKVSELFLGTLKVNWKFLKVGYSALCTESIPLTFFEKMVCGIVDLDGKSDLPKLAKIMGLNYEDDPENLKFRDKAEVEILMETIRGLREFGMITTPDEDYSYIELTSIGKEYYAQGRRYNHGEKRNFTMYYDLMSDSHQDAMSHFSKVSVDGSLANEEIAIPYEDETFVKKYAESQIPRYYSGATGNSFTNMTVSQTEILYKEVVFGVLYDTFTEKYRLIVIDNGGIDMAYLSDSANADTLRNTLLQKFFDSKTPASGTKTSDQVAFEEQIMQIQRDADFEIYNGHPEKALQLVAQYSSSPSFMEVENMFFFVKRKANPSSEVYLNIPKMSEECEEEIEELSKIANVKVMLSTSSYDDFYDKFGPDVMVLFDDEQDTCTFIVNNVKYAEQDLMFPFNGKWYNIGFLKSTDDTGDNPIEEERLSFAQRYVPKDLEKYASILDKNFDNDFTTGIKELNKVESFLHFSDEDTERTGYLDLLLSLRKDRDEKLLDLVQNHSKKLLDELEVLKANTSIDSIDNLDDIEKVKSELQLILDKVLPEQSKDQTTRFGSNGFVIALWDTIGSFKSRIEEREKYLRQNLMAKSFVFDTNVFVLFPNIMDHISQDDQIILPLKVLEELDRLKGSKEGKEKNNIRIAIREINHKIKMKTANVHFESANAKLLPKDYDKKNPDNMILSVALKLSERNPFLVSNDTNLQNKAASLGIPFKSLKDILPLGVYDTIDFTPNKKDKDTANSKPKKEQKDYPKRSSFEKRPDKQEQRKMQDKKASDRTQYNVLEEIIHRMISEEDHTDPVKDGEIRNEYIALTQREIKLKIIVQAREKLGYPSRNNRLENYKNNK